MKHKETLFKSMEMALASPDQFNWSSWSSVKKVGPSHSCETTLCLGGNYVLIDPDRFEIDKFVIFDKINNVNGVRALQYYHDDIDVGPIFSACSASIAFHDKQLSEIFPEHFSRTRKGLLLNKDVSECPARLIVYWVILYGFEMNLFTYEDLTETLKEFFNNPKSL